MLKIRVGLASLVMLAFVSAAGAQTPVQAVEVRVGPASSIGFVSFTLQTSVDGASLAVETVVDSAPLDASQKAALVVARVTNLDPTWQAVASGSTLTFQHLVGVSWQNVDVVSNFTDTTGGGTKLTAADTVVAFTLSIDESAVAVGYDAFGDPSFVTVSMTDTLTWTKPLQGGETAQVVLDAFQTFLAAEAGAGVTVVRNSPFSLTAILHYAVSLVNWQVTDLGLQAASKGEAVRLDDPAMLIRR